MNVAVVCPYDLDRPGGVQQQCLELVTGLRERGHHAWLVGPANTEGEARRVVGRSVLVRGNGSLVPIALHPAVVGNVSRGVAGADVVHVHEPFAPLVGWAGLGVAVPRIATFHADPPPWVRASYRAGAPVARRLLGSLSGATAVSPVAAAPLLRLVRGLEIVPNGVAVERYRQGERSGRRVVFLGRDEKRKGLDVLLAAWPAVATAVDGAELVVMGATRDHSPPGVRFVGAVDQAAKRAQLAEADVLCAPHLGGESFGIVLVEGMAAGCAVVASDLPAFRYVTGNAAVWVDPGDPRKLANALRHVLTDGDLRSRLQQEGSLRARRFDWSYILPRYEEIYARAASRPSS